MSEEMVRYQIMLRKLTDEELVHETIDCMHTNALFRNSNNDNWKTDLCGKEFDNRGIKGGYERAYKHALTELSRRE